MLSLLTLLYRQFFYINFLFGFLNFIQLQKQSNTAKIQLSTRKNRYTNIITQKIKINIWSFLINFDFYISHNLLVKYYQYFSQSLVKKQSWYLADLIHFCEFQKVYFFIRYCLIGDKRNKQINHSRKGWAPGNNNRNITNSSSVSIVNFWACNYCLGVPAYPRITNVRTHFYGDAETFYISFIKHLQTQVSTHTK